jgi:ERCC4-type nuclease
MKIRIDNRERSLIKLMQALKKQYEFNNLDLVVEKLDVGDIIIESNGKELLIVERKSLNDLAGSIKDGRYDEQSFRLSSYNIPNHNIVYLLEGNMFTWEDKRRKMQAKTLYAAMFSLNYYKGFSVIKTNDIMETAEYILRLADKLSREKTKNAYYHEINENNKGQNKKYCEVVSKVKKKNLTPENIGEIILSQIPGVNSTTSMAVLKKYGSLYNLLKELDKNQSCLDKLKYETKSGEKRRISKTSVRNIVQYLLYQKSNVIKIAT